MPECAQGGKIAFVPFIEKSRGPGPERGEKACDRSLNGRDAPEGERGGDEGHDLAVRRIGIAVREDQRVRVEAARAPLAPQGLEALAEEGEIRWAGRASHASTLASSR